MENQNSKHVERLLFDVAWAIQHELGPRDLVPVLEKLIAATEPQSDPALFAKRQLAEVIMQPQPWRAALLLRDVLSHREDDHAFALLGLAHTLLGNYRCAARAYARALAITPDNPWYAHNFGHVLDVALEQPQAALRHLRLAHRKLSHEPEVASSYAHALSRSGRVAEARRVLARALGDAERAEAFLTRWLAETEQKAEPVRVAEAKARKRSPDGRRRAAGRRKKRVSIF